MSASNAGPMRSGGLPFHRSIHTEASKSGPNRADAIPCANSSLHPFASSASFVSR